MTFRQVNKELLSAMEVSTEVIGKVFLELAPYLKFYSTYANDFEKATKLVEEWTEKHKVRNRKTSDDHWSKYVAVMVASNIH